MTRRFAELDKGVKIGAESSDAQDISLGRLLLPAANRQEAIDLIAEVLKEHPEMDGIRPLYADLSSRVPAGEKRHSHNSPTTHSHLARSDHDMAYWVGSTYAILGEKDLAFKWLNRAIKLGNQNKSALRK